MNDKERRHMHRLYCRRAWLAASARNRFLSRQNLYVAKTYAIVLNANVPNAYPVNATVSVVKW